MKPISLKIAGLHSFREEQEIDFTAMCQVGVFGIFGPTGSGKSTVLDAITLALYGRVERAERGTYGIINQHEDRAAVQFKFSIGDREFTAERTYRRNKTGGVNLRHCRLLEHIADEGLVLADRAREMDERVEEIIGLTVADFTRAVVLPQGKFAEFLTLPDRERREMLERIFGLERYGEQLSKRIRTQLASAKTEWEMLTRQQGELGDASAAVLAQARKNLKQEQAALQQEQQNYQQKQEQYEENNQLRQWQQELDNWQAKEKDLNHRAPAMAELTDKLQQAQRAIQIKPYLDQVQTEQTRLEGVQHQLASLAQEAEQADQSYQKWQQRHQAGQQEMQQQGQEWQTQLLKLDGAIKQEAHRDELLRQHQKLQQDRRAVAETSQRLGKNIGQLTDSRSELQGQITQLDKQIARHQVSTEEQQQLNKRLEAWRLWQEQIDRLQELEQELAAHQRQQVALKQTDAKLQRQVNEAQQALAAKGQQLSKLTVPALTQPQINHHREQLAAISLEINTLLLREQALEQQQQQRAAQEQELKQLQQQINQQHQQQAALVAKEQELTTQQAALEGQLKAIERQNLAAILSGQLEPEQACPVCGSTHHPQPAASDGGDLAQIQWRLDQTAIQLTALGTEQKQLATGLTTHQTLLQTKQERLAQATQQQQDLLAVIDELRQSLGQELARLPVAALAQRVTDRQHQLQQDQQDLDHYLQEQEQLRQQHEQLQTQLHQQQEQAAGLKAQKSSLQLQLQGLLDKKQQWQEVSTQRQQVFNKIAAGLSGEQIQQAVIKANQALQLVEQLRQQHQQLTQDLEQVVNDLLAKQQQWQQLQQDLERLDAAGQAYQDQEEQLTVAINQVTGGAKASQLKASIGQRLSQLKDSLATTEGQLEQERLRRETVHRNYYATQQEQTQLQRRLRDASQTLDEKLAAQEFTTQLEVEQALCSAAEIRAMQEQLTSYQEERLVTKEHINQLQLKLAGRRIADQEWQQFLQQWQETQIQLEELKETVTKQSDRLATLEQNHQRWEQLEEQKQQQQTLINKLQQLTDLFRGNAFVQFIAEEQLLNVVLDASRRLGELTLNKYALELSADGNFIIRDDANGGMKRPVSTLSGGETFLTSLALALALSNQIQLRGQHPLEFFFLDEGFGTLDGELLETVMSSLEKLHSAQMTIGVISHVPELRFRMNRRLIVEPPAKGGQGTKVTVEFA